MGALLGAFSLDLFPQVWISSSHLRVANLILVPLTAWYFAGHFANRRMNNGITTNAYLHKLSAVCFSLGLTLVRFVYAVR